MPITPLPIFSHYNKQRFTQFGAMDAANFYQVAAKDSKTPMALFPTMGRKHVESFNQNKLVFDEEPRAIFRSIDHVYVFIGSRVIQVDRFYNTFEIYNEDYTTLAGPIWFDYLPVGTKTFCMLTDLKHIYVIQEGATPTMVTVTDPRAPQTPGYIAQFGNRFVVSENKTPNFYLSIINLGGDSFDPATCFSYGVSPSFAPLFARATGIIKQFGVLHNQLYIFSDFSTDIWANIPTVIEVAGEQQSFPWKLNTSYNWDFGIADPNSLSIDFGMMCWLGKNKNGLVQFMASRGQQPENISTQAINVLLEQSSVQEGVSPFLSQETDGFLYQYENSIFYRVSAGKFLDFGILDVEDSANCIEYNFQTQTWHRCIELNGERNRIRKHVFFQNKHLVTVSNDPAVYQMAGDIYFNETRNELVLDKNSALAFNKYPMRYELVTNTVYQPDFSEFITDWIEIDFVFGDKTFYRSQAPFANAVYIVGEESEPLNPTYIMTESGEYVVQDGTNNPSFSDNHYLALFKPHIELFLSDDGGISYESADVREFSPLGNYRWRMRWYELGPSRNRCYKLVCVSSAPIVILGAIQSIRKSSGGAA